jgi:hypothetical protein
MIALGPRRQKRDALGTRFLASLGHLARSVHRHRVLPTRQLCRTRHWEPMRPIKEAGWQVGVLPDTHGQTIARKFRLTASYRGFAAIQAPDAASELPWAPARAPPRDR